MTEDKKSEVSDRIQDVSVRETKGKNRDERYELQEMRGEQQKPEIRGELRMRRNYS